MKRRLVMLGTMLLISHGAGAQPAVPADWPCVQRYIPTLTAGTYWSGPPAEQDWHANRTMAALVAATAPRAVPQDTADAKLQAYAGSLPSAGRPAVLATLFAGLVDETNRQRTEIMDRLRTLNRRQRNIGGMVEAIIVPASGTDPWVRDEILQRREFLTREFQETERTMRYVCEVPVLFEARLGAFGRTLDAAQ